MFDQKLAEFKQNPTIRMASEALSRAKEEVLRHNEQLLKDLQEYKQSISESAAKVGSVVSKPVQKIGEAIGPVVKNIAESEQAKKLSEDIDWCNKGLESRTDVFKYGGVTPAELRDSRTPQSGTKVEPDTCHTTAVTVRQMTSREKVYNRITSALSPRTYLDTLNSRIEKSDSMLAFFARELKNSLVSSFKVKESDTAACIRQIRESIPNFEIDVFQKNLQQSIAPNIIEAILRADLISLRALSTEAAFNVLKNLFSKAEPSQRGELLDLRAFELLAGKIVDDRPILVYSMNAQQATFRTDESGAIVEEKIENMTYAMAMALIEGEWKLADLSCREASGW